ncbi:Zn(II)2Cys6 transcription factor [Aspergillus undulatus]|uniref:Zn(II)2Cys6 transcription factor n=1 Tax=Aspergillus undulatus TaxID=1810928 RepID=UPI003CCC9D3F
MSGHRNRSAIACEACRRRKVRCTVTVTGVPCINCAQDGIQCAVARRRGTQQAGNQPLREIRAVPDPGPRCSERVSPAQISGSRAVSDPLIFPTQCQRDAPEFTRAPHCLTPDSENSRTEDEERSAADFATASLKPRDAQGSGMPMYTAPQSVARHIFRPMSHPNLTPQDIEYFKLKGCLELPSASVRRDLFHAYFHNVHPILPVVDAAEVLKHEQQGVHQAEHNLLLLWSIFFAAVNSQFIPVETCALAGYSSRKEMKEAMYSRAKCMHNNNGGDRITEMQSALLLGFWHSEMNNHAQPWYWTGVAISLGQIMGLHRDFDAVRSNPSITNSQRALWRRLWWSCVYRDGWLSLTLGRPLRINLLDCDVPMPSVPDVLSDMSGISPSVAASFVPGELSQLSEYWILLLRLSKSLGDVLTLSYRPRGTTPTISEVEAIEQELVTLGVPDRIDPAAAPRTRFAISHLQLHYQACLITLYRRFTNRVPDGIPSTRHTAYQSMIRSKVDAAALQTNTILDYLAREQLLHFAGPMTPPLLVPAMHIHLLNCKSGDPLTQQLSLNKLDFCMLILKVLRDVHSAASFYRALFFEAIRHVLPDNSNATEQKEVDADMPSAIFGEQGIDAFFSGNVLDDLMDEASFFNFWETLSNI